MSRFLESMGWYFVPFLFLFCFTMPSWSTSYLLLYLAVFCPQSGVRELWLVDWTGERERVSTVALQWRGETRKLARVTTTLQLT